MRTKTFLAQVLLYSSAQGSNRYVLRIRFGNRRQPRRGAEKKDRSTINPPKISHLIKIHWQLYCNTLQ